MQNKNCKSKRPTLNHAYRLVWSDTKQMYIAVAESNPGRGKRTGGVVGAIAALMMGFGGAAHALDPGALPTGANVTHGNATINQSGNVMNIHQSTDKLITNWNSFNIGQDATVNFHQPNSNSAALNRVVENNPSQILGNLNANGNVYLVNPSGILFGHNAQVDVGGLIASTLDITDQDFINGNLHFKNLGFSEGDIKNLGHIRANGGVVAFIANRVSNQGTIEANNGNIALAAGDQVTLDFNGDGLMTVKVEQGVLDALAENGGLIQADGGFVIMTTQAQNDIYKSVVNNDGIIQARTLQADKSGRIMLMGGMSQGQVIASGKLDASAPITGDGGFIETSAANVQIQPDLVVTTKAESGKTGEWLIDPTDIAIVAGTGGDFAGDPVTSGSSSIGADTLVANLANNNITVQTPSEGSGAGDILVNADIVWDANTTLTLDAINNIYVNAKIENTHTSRGGVYFAAKNTGDAVIFDATHGKVVIHNADQLQWMNTAVAGNYSLARDLDLSNVTFSSIQGETTYLDMMGMTSITQQEYDALSDDYKWEYSPQFAGFSGDFDGQGHQISDLSISKADTNYVGFFSKLESGASVRNIGLVNIDIKGRQYVGGIAGESAGQIVNSYTTGSVSGSFYIGGAVGNKGVGGQIQKSYSTASISLIGDGNKGQIGGLVGANNGAIEDSYASGQVGLALGQTNTVLTIGGLVGANSGVASISNSYATGSVKGTENVGGLIGNNSSVNVNHSFSTGKVEGTTDVGGLIGRTTTNIAENNSNFWDKDTSFQTTSAGGGSVVGKTTTELQNASSFIGWDTDIWILGDGYPQLAWAAASQIPPCATTPGMPSCGTVVNGNGTIGEITDNNLTITQTDAKLIIDWKQFDIAAGNTVHFDQKLNGAAQTNWVALNRVTGNNPSSILGNLTADGKVYLVNPSGILFGANSQIDVAGLVASNLNVTNTEFEAGNMTFAAPTSPSYVSIQGDTTNWNIGTGGFTLASASDFVVGADAPNETKSGISATALQNRLNEDGVEIRAQNTGGSASIDLLTDIKWDADNALTLNADTINVNAQIANTSTNDGGVRFQSANSVFDSENGLVEIHNANQLQRMNTALDGNYALGSSFSLSSITNWTPIGNSSTKFSGNFDGKNNTLSNLTITDIPSGFAGLFGATDGAIIKNVGVIDVDIRGLDTGKNNVGILVGNTFNNTVIDNVYTTGIIDAGEGRFIGGIAGGISGTLTNSYSTATVKGGSSLGGLVGNINSGYIDSSYATGDVTGTGNAIGGLAGASWAYYDGTATIRNSYAIGVVSGVNNVGGLIGYTGDNIENSYALGKVTGSENVGGLVGQLDSYASGGVSKVQSTYSTGLVTGNTNVGGLVGSNPQNSNSVPFIIENSFWDTQSSNTPNSAGGEGKTTEQMKTLSTFAGWDTSVWTFHGGGGAAVAGYEMGGNILPYLTQVTRVEDRDKSDAPTYSLFAGGWGGQTSAQQAGSDSSAYGIADWNQLQNINLVLGDGFDFVLNNNLTNATNGYADQASATANGNKGWQPIGDETTAFTGNFDGQGRTISGLVINRPDALAAGLFGSVAGSQDKATEIQNIGLINANVTGGGLVGALVGASSQSIITNSYVTGGSVSSTAAAVNPRKLYAIGGLVGADYASIITNNYANTNVSLTATEVKTDELHGVGGLVGYVNFNSQISNSYASGKVLSTVESGDGSQGQGVGGLVGINFESGITNTYATGAVTGVTDSSSAVGGLVGFNSGTITNSFWNTETTTQNTGVGASESDGVGSAGNTTAELQTLSTFTDWDISANGGVNTIWRIYEGATAPLLRSFMTKLAGTVSFTNATRTYDATDQVNDDFMVIWEDGADDSLISGDNPLLRLNSKDAGAKDVLGVEGYSSTQQGYDLNVTLPVAGSFEITQANLIISGLTAEGKVYDGSKVATVVIDGVEYAGLLKGDQINIISAAGEFADKNVGTDKNITITSQYGGADVGNYNIQDQTTTTATITAKELIISGLTAEGKVYDGNKVATIVINGVKYAGLVDGDEIKIAASGEFADKNVGESKAITIQYSGADVGNYTITEQTPITASITPLSITVAADDKEKRFGAADPALTWQVVEGALIESDSLSGGLIRMPGEQAATYSINQGDLDNLNYQISFIDGVLTIVRLPQNDELSINENAVESGNQDVQVLFNEQQGSSNNSIALVQDNRDFVPIAAVSVAAEPVVVQVTTLSLNGEFSTVRFTSEGRTRSLELDNTEVTELVSQSSLPVFNSSAGQVSLREVVSVQDRGSSISTESSIDVVDTPMPNISQRVFAQQTPAAVQNSDGSASEVNVGVTDDDLLVIEVPDDLELTNDDQLTLVGIAAAKRMGVSVDRLKGVVIARR